jgi:hypothetical protein
MAKPFLSGDPAKCFDNLLPLKLPTVAMAALSLGALLFVSAASRAMRREKILPDGPNSDADSDVVGARLRRGRRIVTSAIAVSLVIAFAVTVSFWRIQFTPPNDLANRGPIEIVEIPADAGDWTAYSRWELTPPGFKNASWVRFSGGPLSNAESAATDKRFDEPWKPPHTFSNNVVVWISPEIAASFDNCWQGDSPFGDSPLVSAGAGGWPSSWPGLTRAIDSILVNTVDEFQYGPQPLPAESNWVDLVALAKQKYGDLIPYAVALDESDGYSFSCSIKDTAPFWRRTTDGYAFRGMAIEVIVAGGAQAAQAALYDINGTSDFYFDHGSDQEAQVIDGPNNDSRHWFNQPGFSSGSSRVGREGFAISSDAGPTPVYIAASVRAERDIALVVLGALVSLVIALAGAVVARFLGRFDRAER